MPKSTDSFFIRFEQDAGTVYAQSAQDLGAFVDALGQSVLRIHNVSVQYTDVSNVKDPIYAAENTTGLACWQLSTQSQDALITQGNRSMVSCGSLACSYVKTSDSAVGGNMMFSEDASLNPERFTNGYLIAVEQLYFATQKNGNIASGDVTVSVVLECTVEKLSKEAALALALSQQ